MLRDDGIQLEQLKVREPRRACRESPLDTNMTRLLAVARAMSQVSFMKCVTALGPKRWRR